MTGWTRDYHGALEVFVPDPTYITRSPAPADSRCLRSSPRVNWGRAHEGRLLWVSGRVVRFGRQAIVLDDGTGAACVYFPAELGWRRRLCVSEKRGV